MFIKRDKFDFDIGYLIKSPCRECPNQENLPKCSDACVILDDIRLMLAKGVSCTGKYSSAVF